MCIRDRAEAVQEQTAAALQELADMQEKKTELKGEIKSLSGTVAALKAAERVRVDFDTIQPEKTLTGAVKGVTVDQIRQLKDVAMTGAAAKQTVVDLKKKNAVLEEEKAELKKKIPSVHEKMEAAAQRSRLESQNRQLWSENEELKEALEEERSFSDRLLEGIDRVLDMLERHLPKQLLQLHRAAIPIGYPRTVLPQLGAGSDHPEALQNALHLRLLNRRSKPLPHLPGETVIQLLQNLLILRVHRAVSYTHLDVYKRQVYRFQICRVREYFSSFKHFWLCGYIGTGSFNT